MTILKNSAFIFFIVFGFLPAVESSAQEQLEQSGVETQQAERITKSRSNIQNNREGVQAEETGPVEPAEPAADDGGEQLIKTKTKSNQSND